MQINDTLNARPLNLTPTNDLNALIGINQTPFNIVNSSAQSHSNPHFEQTNLLVGLIDRMLNFIFSIVDRLLMNPIQPIATVQENSNAEGGLWEKGSNLIGDIFNKVGQGLFSKITSGISKIFKL